MAKLNYRHLARQALKRAEAELVSADDSRLTYAALELRVAMECLAYERVLLYKNELPPEKLGIWQPRKIMAVLLELDPSADKTCSLAVAIESSPGVRSEPFKSLGTDRVISNKEIKKYYDKLGSYLHAPTVRQATSDSTTSPDKVRSRCQEMAAIIGEALSSPVFNINIRSFATLPCERCGEEIVRRLKRDGEDADAKCPACGAGYSISQLEDDKVEWMPHQETIQCRGETCTAEIHAWMDELDKGAHWTCDECGGRNVVSLGIQFYPPEGEPLGEEG